MIIRKAIASLSLLVVLPLASACGTDTATTAGTATAGSTSSGSASSGTAEPPSRGDAGSSDGGPGQSVDASSVTTEAELVALVQDAYGDAPLGLHRGHEPVQDVLDEVLTISHDELHVRMEEQGQNLAAVAEDIGVDPQTLVDALVESRRTAVDGLRDSGTITQDEADGYLAALEDAFTFRVTWDGEEETPTFSGLDA